MHGRPNTRLHDTQRCIMIKTKMEITWLFIMSWNVCAGPMWLIGSIRFIISIATGVVHRHTVRVPYAPINAGAVFIDMEIFQ